MENLVGKEIWLVNYGCVEFQDCNGVYSTREKAEAAVLADAERCSDIWKALRNKRLPLPFLLLFRSRDIYSQLPEYQSRRTHREYSTSPHTHPYIYRPYHRAS